jgi:translation initiation factor IF-1
MIVLDAELTRVVSNRAFGARLSNGHELVAFAGRDSPPARDLAGPGDRVRVRLSPFDMSQGEIVEWMERGSL